MGRSHGVRCLFFQRGRPVKNGYIQRFDRTHREDVLDCYVFETMSEVCRLTGAGRASRRWRATGWAHGKFHS
jgi:hypothetical protein